MRLHELEALYEQLSKEHMHCGDLEYGLITNMRRAVSEYIDAINLAGGDPIHTKTVTRSWEIEQDPSLKK